MEKFPDRNEMLLALLPDLEFCAVSVDMMPGTPERR